LNSLDLVKERDRRHTWLTYCPVDGVQLEFFFADEVPDTGEPVSQNSEHSHQQRQDNDAILRVTIQLLQQSGQPQEASYLEQMDQRTLFKNTAETEVLKGAL